MKIYNPKVDLVNDNVYTKFGLNKSICSQNIEEKLNSDVNQGRLLCCKFATIDNRNIDLVNDNVYSISVFILKILNKN